MVWEAKRSTNCIFELNWLLEYVRNVLNTFIRGALFFVAVRLCSRISNRIWDAFSIDVDFVCSARSSLWLLNTEHRSSRFTREHEVGHKTFFML